MMLKKSGLSGNNMDLMIDNCAICGCEQMELDEVEIDDGNLYCAFICRNCNKYCIQKAEIEYR